MSGQVPLRRVARFVYGDALAEEIRRAGRVPVVSSGGITGTHDVANTQGPAIVVGRKGSYGSVHWINHDCFVIDTAYNVIPMRAGIDIRWLYYVLSASNLRALSQDVGVPGLSREAVYESLVPAPPSYDEQRRIADFLDAETARVDKLRALRAHQVDALVGREISFILELFAGSSEPGPRRSTMWPWMPSVPAAWSIGPVYAYFATDLGKMLNPERSIGDNQRPYLRNANVHWYDITTEDMATMSFGTDELIRYALMPGDLMVCEGGAGVAEAAVWDGHIRHCYFQKSLHRVRSSGAVPVEWLMYWLRLAKHVGQFDAEGNLSTIPHLTGEQLRTLRLPIPPDASARVVRLGEAVGKLAVIRRELLSAEKLLAERRDALITAAVTGQLDVSTARGTDLS